MEISYFDALSNRMGDTNRIYSHTLERFQLRIQRSSVAVELIYFIHV